MSGDRAASPVRAVGGEPLRVLVLAGHWPAEHLDNAGAVVVLRHVDALAAEGLQVVLAIPRSSRCDPREHGLDPRVAVGHLPGAAAPASPAGRAGRVLARTLAGELSPGRGLLRAWRDDPELRRLVAAADVVEVHWSEFLAARRLLRQMSPRVFLVGFDHDVKWQNLQRRAAATPDLARRLLAAVAGQVARRAEPATLNRYDLVLVPAGKDRALLTRLGVRVPVLVRGPWVAPVVGPAALTEPVVLFTGAMARPENDVSAHWFLDRVWPLVSAQMPTARLVVAGASPSTALRARASARVQVTGYVPDLGAVYSDARVFVVPLVMGAGLKTKVPQAMQAGLPVVATRIGAEGMAPELFAAVTDDPAELGAAVLRCLRDTAFARAAGERGQQWAAGLSQQFRDDTSVIASCYRAAVARRRP